MTDNTLDLSQSLDTVRKLLKITDNGDDTFSIAVSGTVNLSATDNAVLDSILADLQLKADKTESQLVTIDTVTGDISTNNSTVAVLGSGGVFTGTADIVTDYKSIGIIVKASHASATSGMTFQFSPDGTNWDIVHSFTLSATTGTFYNIPVEAKYFRIVYTNSAAQQTYFRLQTIYHATVTKESTLRLSEDVSGELAAQLGRMIITGT